MTFMCLNWKKKVLWYFKTKLACIWKRHTRAKNVLSSCRSTRESTPCSLIRDSEAIGTPGSTTRPTCSSSASQRARNTQRGAIPTTPEMEEFFAGFELHQQKLFIEKYFAVLDLSLALLAFVLKLIFCFDFYCKLQV